LKQILLKQFFRGGTIIWKKKENQSCLYKRKIEPNRLEIFLKKFYIKFRDLYKELFYSERRKKKEIYQPIVLKLLVSNLLAEFFVLGKKSELP
jgi:hypothetical protein